MSKRKPPQKLNNAQEADELDARPRRDLAAALYRPDVARLIIIGEAPPPVRFFFYGDSLFFRYLRRAFADVLPEVELNEADWFLAFFRALGGWRVDVCDAPQRATKGGAEGEAICAQSAAFEARWSAQARDKDALVVVSPKRLAPLLPEIVQNEIGLTVPPPGQWNAHRQAFLREMAGGLTRHFGRENLRAIAQTVDEDDTRLDFEIARACGEGENETELMRLVTGHPRENELRAVWQSAKSLAQKDDE